VLGGFHVLPYLKEAGWRNDDKAFVFRLILGGVFTPLTCEAKPGDEYHVCTMLPRSCSLHLM
jgi:hypothetical protein